MRLLIVSHTAHYRSNETWAGWGPTLREIDHLARLFNEVVHVAPVHAGPPPESALPYAAPNVRLAPVLPAGGISFKDKLSILACYPRYALTIQREIAQADVVHVRCPANISLLAIVMLALLRHPRRRWLKYAGNWQPNGAESWSYTVQRWWLAHGPHGGQVTVNGHWPNQPDHVHAFFNPCLTEEELDKAKQIAASKHLSSPLRLLYVGRLERAKGVHRTLHVLAKLQAKGIKVTLDLVGDGPERSNFVELANDLNIQKQAIFHGWMPRTELGALYAPAHIMLLPSNSEGWPKVLSEAMAYGVVPVASNVGSIPGYLQQFGCGYAIEPNNVSKFVEVVSNYLASPQRWKTESLQAMQAANNFTYQHHLDAVRNLLNLPVNR